MDRNTLSNLRVRMHYDKSRELTNKLLFMHAATVEDNDKTFVFNSDVANSLKWPSNVKTMHDYRMMYSGIYDRLYQICVISLCSDIEFFSKIFLMSMDIQREAEMVFFNDSMMLLQACPIK